jgi:predicted ATPase/class 3 adenylate cyclase
VALAWASSDSALAFLFSDLEGSTRLWEEHADAMPDALARHDAVLTAALEAHGGRVFKHTGDGMCAVFRNAADAVEAAAAAQVALRREPWGRTGPLRARMAVHVGSAEERDGDYYGPTLNRCARLLETAHGGQVVFSDVVAGLVRDRLVRARCLGEHRLRDLTAPERIHQLVHPQLEDDFPPLRTLDVVPNNLPLQLTALVGRERELREVLALLSESRLMTLTGVGGCGKSRLALQAAADATGGYREGVRLVELAPLADESLVAAHVAAAVGLSDAPGLSGSLEQRLVEALSAKDMLIVLDNCEHLVEAVAALAEQLLRGCRELTLLATSREPIGIAGERVWPVPPLAPADAVALFVERARELVPSFTAGDDAPVRRVCERLDGIPLAIELAAARTRHLTPDEIAARLEHSFDVLANRSRTALPRQRTLRAALDWSHDLLDDAERVLFRRLCVFAGGWTLAAAEAICADEALPAHGVLDLLSELVEKSLVVVDGSAGGTTRYRLLEPVRQYASERLAGDAAPREAERLRARHRDWYLDLARSAAPRLLTRPREWLPRVAPERENFRTALEYSAMAGDDGLLRLVSVLYTFWISGGHVGEGRRWTERALQLEDVGTPRRRALVMDVAGQLDQYQGDYETALALHRRAIDIWRREGGRGLAWSLFGLGRALGFRGDRSALPPLDESLRLALDSGDRVIAGWCHLALAHVHVLARDWSRANAHLDEALALAEEAAYPGLRGLTLVVRGLNAALAGDVAAGHALSDRGLAIVDEQGDRWSAHWAYANATIVAVLAGDRDEARRLVVRTLQLTRDGGAHEVLDGSLGCAAVVLGNSGRHEVAARLWAAADAIADLTGVSPLQREVFRAGESMPRRTTERTLDDTTLRREQAVGRAMSIEQAISYALDQLHDV